MQKNSKKPRRGDRTPKHQGTHTIELKSIEKLLGIHEARLLTNMKLAEMKTGLLVNFNVTKLKEGIKRFVL